MKFAHIIAFAFLGLCQGETIVEFLEANNQSTMLSLLELTELKETLSGPGPWTLFLPTQSVFEALPDELVEAITADVEILKQVLLYHVVPGEAPSSALANELLLTTAQGADLRVNLYETDGTTVATVAGVPINLDHVDIVVDNGIIHFLKGVILSIPVGNTVETRGQVEEFNFEALAYALEGAELLEIVNALEDVTILAPIDSDAFNVEVVDSLLEDPDVLTDILLNHVASGTLFSAGIGLETEVTTIFGGGTIVVKYTQETGYAIYDVDGNLLADVIAGDIPTTQGVVHIIDRPIIL